MSSKNLLYTLLTGILLFSFSNRIDAQLEVEPTGPLFSPESLITNVFLGEGVEVTNLTYDGSEQAVGFFTNGINDIGIDRGIIMTSGLAITAATANNAGGTTGATTGPGTDPDLGPIAPGALNDISRYEITFIPTSDTLQFKYAFASEEYPEWACNTFNDVFGFFLTGPNPAGGNYASENIALVPDPADPTGGTFTNVPVTINNVNNQGINVPGGCNFDYGNYYNDNAGSMTLTYDAFLDVFIAQAVVVPCQEYTIKLAIADVGDNAFDTGVFLEAKSFGTGALEVEFASLSLDGTITEDCAQATLNFELPSVTESDYVIDYTIIGTAENGVDYQQIPLDLTIQAGDSSVAVDVIAWEDGLDEGVESIGIDVQRDPCNRDTFWLFIRDNEILPPQLGNDTTICRGDSVLLDGTLPIPLPDPPVFSNETDFPIVTISNNNPPPPGTLPTQSEIQVFGVQPTTLQEGVIKSICLDIDHPWISDVDVFLLGPNGQFIELTTDNGGSGDDYVSTCFVPTATDPINFGSQAPSSAAPFTGEWQPEGLWEDLWTIQDPLTNGIWTLQIKDDQTGFNGTLNGWSICFNPVYQIFYEWTPSAGLSCTDCPDPVATPDTTTTYYLTAYDTYGCEVYDTITINVLDQLPPPDVTCTNITNNSIDFCWDPIPGANGYEVNVDSTGWISPNGALCHTVSGLSLNDTVNIQVVGLDLCDGEIGSITCWTPDCTPPSGNILSQLDVGCFGDSTGTVTIEGTGVFPPFEYMIADIDTNSTGVFTNLPAGDYTALVIDALGCPQSVPFTIGEPQEIQTTEVLVNSASCNGGNDGSVTVEVNGGTAPYSFNWDNSQFDSIAVNLVVGDYYVTVTDAIGCTTVDTVSVAQPPVMSLSSLSDSVSCNGNIDGVATVIVDGGVGPYSFQWDATTGNQTDSIALGLSGGIYTVTVSDQNNCTEILNVEIIENPALVLNIAGTDLSCFNADDGTATITAMGGTGTYTYEWNDPGMQTGQTAIDLTAGNVTVLVTDSDGCFATADITLTQPTELQIVSQFTDALCNQATDGSITITPSGGTAPYTYNWADDPTATDSLRNTLIAGMYTVTVTDDQGCTEVAMIDIDEPDAIALNFSSTDVNCNAGNDGFASVIPSGGTAPYTFQWDANANNQTTQLANTLSAGTYFVTVTDDQGCSSVSSVVVNEPTALSLSNDNINVLCFGNSTGEVDLNISGGTTPYNIQWTGPNGYSSNQEDIDALFSGDYNVIITDGNGCTATLTTTINQPATGIMSTISEPDSICFEAGNGIVSVNVGGGTGPFTYEWNNSETTSTLNNLDGGMYIVTITDSGNCTFIDTAFVVEEAEIIVALSQTGSLCHDGGDGTATLESITVAGSIMPLGDYTILWNQGGQSSTTINNLTGGQTYTVTVTNIQGCTGTQSITVDNPAEIGSRIDMIEDADCFGGSDGSIMAQGEGGVAPYTYLWDINANNQMTAMATDLSAGSYSVTVTDANGCFTVNTAIVGQPDQLSLDFQTTGTDCFDSATGTARVDVSGGIAPYTYLWSEGSVTSNLENIRGGIYTVTITDQNGCTMEDQAIVSQPEELQAEIDFIDISCFEGRDGEIIFLPQGGTPPYTYSLDGENYNGSDIQIGLTAGFYPAYIRDSKGCEQYLGEHQIEQPEEISIDLGETIVIQYGETATLNPEVTGGFGSYTFNYNLVDSLTLSCIVCENPQVNPTYTTDYEVLVTDENGCTAEARILVVVEKDRPVYVPTGFTPNGDGTNDVLRIHGTQISRILAFRLYDRWGEMVYEDLEYEYDPTDTSKGWNGNFKDEPMNPGVYVWYVEVEYVDGTTANFNGNTTLIR